MRALESIFIIISHRTADLRPRTAGTKNIRKSSCFPGRWSVVAGLSLCYQSFHLCQHLVLGEVFLRGRLARTDRGTGPTALAQGFINR